MSGIIESILATFLTVELIVGTLGNGFLVLANIAEWIKVGKISVVYQIFTALGVSRLALLLIILINLFLSMRHSNLMMTRMMMKIMTFSWMVCNHFNMWLTACLNLLYFLKIVNFSNSLFAYLKWRATKVVSVTLLISLVFLGINVILLNAHSDNWPSRHSGNQLSSSSLNYTMEFYRVILTFNGIFLSIPFIMCQTTLFLLIFSLLKHLKNMQHSTHGFRDSSTMAHIKALQTVVASGLLSIIFFMAFFFQLYNLNLMEHGIYVMVSQIIGAAFPLIHSCVLILGNTKLKQTSLSVLWCLSCR